MNQTAKRQRSNFARLSSTDFFEYAFTLIEIGIKRTNWDFPRFPLK